MKVKDFLKDIEQNCSEIVCLSMNHVYKKLYKDIEEDIDTKENLIAIIENYPLLLQYLNDYAGTIYNRYASSTQEIYIELCRYYNLEIDNKYTFNLVLKKLQKQTPSLLMGLTDEDIKIQTIENFEDKLKDLKNSTYYKQNKIELESSVNKLVNNIELVKKASQL